MTPDVLAGILPRVYPQMLEVVRSHQDAGRPCYIATAASQPMAEMLAEVLAMDGAFGTPRRCATASTRAGSTAPSPTAREKREALRRFAAEQGIDLAQSWAYTDAASDLPMLEAVGHPVAVNPDAGLAEVARREGWEVLRFEKLGERLRVAGACWPRPPSAAAAAGWRRGAARTRSAAGCAPDSLGRAATLE